MRKECIEAVTKAIGRKLRHGEAADIEARILNMQRLLARRDPQAWHAMSKADRFTLAAKAAADELVDAAKLAEKRAALGVLAQAHTMNYVFDSAFEPYEAIQRKLAYFADGKSGTLSIESAAKAIKSISWAQMLEVIDATKGKFFGLLNDPEQSRDFVRELHGQDTGNATAKMAAARFHAVAEQSRERFNAGGGDIGKLESWGIPQSHSPVKVAKAGREAWIDYVMPRLDRSQYLNDDGTLMDNAQMKAFLEPAWLTIATDGASKIEPGSFTGNGARANRGSAHRSIHFKDGDAWIDYQAQFGERSLLQILDGHLSGMARDIALVEEFGPNPNNLMRYLMDHYQKEQAEANPVKVKEIGKERRRTEALYAEVAGSHEPPASELIAASFDTVRSLNVAARLGSAVVTALADQGTLVTAAGFNRLPVWQVLKNELALLNPANKADRDVARRAGLGIEQMVGGLNRFASEGLGTQAETASRIAKWSETAAAKVMQASGMNALTSAAQQGYGMVMLDTIGGMTRKAATLVDLDAHDAAFFQRAGVSETHWAVWKLAGLDDFRGSDTILTSRAILKIPDEALADLVESTGLPAQALRENAATRLMGAVQDEVFVGVTEPGARERAYMYGQHQRGTLGGELYRSFWQFKSFAVAMIMRHYARAMAQQTGWGKAGYLAALTVSTTLLGGVAIQLNELLSGRDPRDMTDPRFALASLLKGGSLGIFGDFLFSDATQHGGSFIGTLAGPVAGDVESLYQMTVSNVHKATAGKETDFGADVVKFGKGKLPGANLWYTKAAMDHMVFHNLQEFFSPGYLRRMEQRANKEYGQEYWWEPGEIVPERAPDLAAIGGE